MQSLTVNQSQELSKELKQLVEDTLGQMNFQSLTEGFEMFHPKNSNAGVTIIFDDLQITLAMHSPKETYGNRGNMYSMAFRRKGETFKQYKAKIKDAFASELKKFKDSGFE